MRMEKMGVSVEGMTTGVGGGGGSAVKVMTDDQIEMLRKQISIYETICERLADWHKSITATRDSISLSGMRMGNMYYDPRMMTSSSYGGSQQQQQQQQYGQYHLNMMTARQRWNPTAMQLQILERMFSQGNGTPNKGKIKEITSELSQHGEISETNVYNWFQNRRARSKRKQAAVVSSTSTTTTTDSE